MTNEELDQMLHAIADEFRIAETISDAWRAMWAFRELFRIANPDLCAQGYKQFSAAYDEVADAVKGIHGPSNETVPRHTEIAVQAVENFRTTHVIQL